MLAFAACALLVASLNLWWEGALSPAGIAPATAPAASAPGITTLASRIQAAAPGEVIQVQPGRITESLRIEKPVRLTALGTALAEKG
ncbi:MAG: hypothetical protein HYV26_00625 [Candidatus Hydrogenedentes bacterium]|nr:hypothetical protein [Candidatus Hydrogenedentota bacterium]